MLVLSMSDDGNVVLAYTSDCLLMLDVDLKRQDETVEFAREYTLAQDLGSALVMMTSDIGQLDLELKPLKSFCVIFGKCPLDWEEIKWHLTEARRLGMIQRSFLALRKFGYITIRVNAKNNRISYPKKVITFTMATIEALSYFSGTGECARI